MEEENKVIDEVLRKMEELYETAPKQGYELALHEGEENSDYYYYIAKLMKDKELIRWSRHTGLAYLTNKGLQILDYGGWLRYLHRPFYKKMLENKSVLGALLGIATSLIFLLISLFFL